MNATGPSLLEAASLLICLFLLTLRGRCHSLSTTINTTGLVETRGRVGFFADFSAQIHIRFHCSSFERDINLRSTIRSQWRSLRTGIITPCVTLTLENLNVQGGLGNIELLFIFPVFKRSFNILLWQAGG